MFCPQCKAEYREGFTRCADCDVELIEPLPPEPAEGELLRQAAERNTLKDDAMAVPDAEIRRRSLSSATLRADELTSDLPVPVNTRRKGVRGWLLFFVILLTCLNPLATLVALVPVYVELESSRSIFQPSLFIFFIHAVLLFYFGVSGFGVYAGIALWRIRPGAVRLAKRFLLTFLVVGIADWFLTLSFQGGQADFGKDLRYLIWSCGLWYSYLVRSKRVAATYSLDSASCNEHAANVPSALPDGWDPQETTIEVWSGKDTRLVQALRDCFRENGISCAALSEPTGIERILIRSKDESRAREILCEITDGTPPV